VNAKPLLSVLTMLGAAACVHAGASDGGSQDTATLVCGENPTPAERRVFIALPDPGVEPGGMPFVDKPVLQACDVDTVSWYGPDQFTIKFDDPAGTPLENAAQQAQARMTKAGVDFPSNGKGQLKLKVKKGAEKDKPYKYSVIVPGHTPLDPQVIIRK